MLPTIFIQNLGDKIKDPREDRTGEKIQTSRKWSESSLKTSETPLKALDTYNQRGTLKHGEDPSRLLQKAKVVDDKPSKTLKTQESTYSNCDGHIRK